MAVVTIYSEHRDTLDALITSGKVKSAAGATKTGPFRDQRDAYVFAASLALALGGPCAEGAMPKSKKGVTTIRDSVVFGAAGAEELSCAAVLLSEGSGDPFEAVIRSQLELISDERLQERLTLLDRYAFVGFEWLKEHQKDESTVRELTLSALNDLSPAEVVVDVELSVLDPLFDVLLD
jgi:hypothetical protein